MLASFQQACYGADMALIEGAMGLYDGLDSEGWGSTAHLARLLKVPIILTVNATRMTGSIAAMVTGYQRFQPDVNIAAVILNDVSGSRHERKLVTAVEQYCGIPVVGRIPRDPDLHMRQRHLGHIPLSEVNESESIIQRICRKVEPHLDLDTILTIAGKYKAGFGAHSPDTWSEAAVARIGVMLDRVFNFYYPENLEALRRAGAELVFINSLQDRLPEIDGLYVGGGFPEFYLGGLEANRSLRWDIADAVNHGLPVYAECAGLMYLCRSIRWKGQLNEMVGVIPADVELSRRPQGHGYVVAEVAGENPLFPLGMILRGHEFHHSKLCNADKLDFAYRIKRGHGIDGKADGITHKNVFAAYTHLHALGSPQWAKGFVSLAVQERKCRSSDPVLTK
jgi:cobyrinic acid a,c-diamide synthase